MAQPNTQYSQSDILGMIDAQGKSYGLSSDQIAAAKTVAIAEGAGGQQIGDAGTSFGPLQFHVGGMLNGFAAWLADQGFGNVSLDQAGTVANQRPDLAIQYALEHGGYLSQALQAGAAAGNSGLNLALYAEQFGQRAAQTGGQLVASVYSNVASAWAAITRGGGNDGGTSSGYTFPLVGWSGPINPHWGQQSGGSDLFAPSGTPIVSIGGGTVTFAGWDPIGGYAVQIHGADGLDYYYAHLRDNPLVNIGQQIASGVSLGYVGNTGDASNGAPHLHIGIGHGIATGSGATGGTGIGFDAVSFLSNLLGGKVTNVFSGVTAGVSGTTTTTTTTTAPTWTLAPGINVGLPDWLTKGSAPTGNNAQVQATAGVGSALAAIAQGITGIPQAINNAVANVEKGAIRVGWIILGLFLATIGLWLMVHSSERSAD